MGWGALGSCREGVWLIEQHLPTLRGVPCAASKPAQLYGVCLVQRTTSSALRGVPCAANNQFSFTGCGLCSRQPAQLVGVCLVQRNSQLSSSECALCSEQLAQNWSGPDCLIDTKHCDGCDGLRSCWRNVIFKNQAGRISYFLF